MNTKPKKARIHQNIWGNIYGYLGTKRVIEFGTDEVKAQAWLRCHVRGEAHRWEDGTDYTDLAIIAICDERSKYTPFVP